MSFIGTKMFCNNCKKEFDMAFQLPDGVVTVYPDKNKYVIGSCDKERGNFTLNCICCKCHKHISKTYTKEEFDRMDYSILE